MSNQKSYDQILKSSSIMGGAAGFVMLLGLIRTKFAALLIGTTGVGLLASLSSIQATLSTLSGLGLSSSAVREMAAAVGKDDQPAVSRAVSTLQHLSWFTGLAGMVLLVAASPLVSWITFGTNQYTLDIAALGLIVLAGNLSAAQLAVLQGLRRIGDMARANVYGTAVATVLSVVFYSWLALRGIVPALIAAAFVQLAFAHHFVRRIGVPPARQSWRDTWRQGRSMVPVGASLMWSSLLVSAVGYITIYLINRFENVQAVGIYSAAFVLSGAFVSFVLNAMGADYFPRLTGMVDDPAAMTRLVNEQTEIGVLLATPGLLACMVFSPWLVHLLYSSEFMPAAHLLQWFLLGCLGRVISWPMAFIILAMGKGRWFFLTETASNALHAILIAAGLFLFGIEGVAVAFFLLYVAYTVAVYLVGQRLIGFHWNAATSRLSLTSIVLLSLGFIVSRTLPSMTAAAIGVLVVPACVIHCVRSLVRRTGADSPVALKILRIPGGRLIAGL